MLAWGSLFMYCDYHTHTPLCLHASGTPQEYVQSAVRAGLREYGISDHAPMQEEPFDDWRMKQADMGAYLDWIREATELIDGMPAKREAVNIYIFKNGVLVWPKK